MGIIYKDELNKLIETVERGKGCVVEVFRYRQDLITLVAVWPYNGVVEADILTPEGINVFYPDNLEDAVHIEYHPAKADRFITWSSFLTDPETYLYA